MDKLPDKSPDRTIRSLHITAFAGSVFALILSVMLILNYLQMKRIDPLNSRTLILLNERLKTNPEDKTLREEIRSLDLLARKAFFTSQWQIRIGGYLLLISGLVVVISLKATDFIVKISPDEPGRQKLDFWERQSASRKWIAGAGVVMICSALILAFMTDHELGRDLENALGGAVAAKGEPANANVGSDKANRENGAVELPTDVPGMVSDSVTQRADQASGFAVNPVGFPTQAEIRTNFPGFRGPGGIGIDHHKNIPISWEGKSGKNIIWKTKIPLPGFNSPIVWGDRIFLSGANETRREIYGIDAGKGTILWTTVIDKVPGSPAKAPAVNKETGQAAPGMTTDGRRVYAIFANGDIAALNFEGKIVWVKNLGVPSNHYGHSSSLIMYKDRVIVQYDQRGSAAVMALAGPTGDVIWKTQRAVKVSWASPVLVHTGTRMELILAAEPFIAAYDPENGKELWRTDCINGEVGPSVAYADGRVFSVNEYSKLVAIQLGEQPRILWEDSEYLSDVPSPVATAQYLFLATSYGTVVCYNVMNGEKFWEHEFDQTIYSSPMIAEGRIYLLDKLGVMYIFNASDKFQLIGQPALGEGTFCTPAFTDGRIYIRGNNHLYCIGK